MALGQNARVLLQGLELTKPQAKIVHCWLREPSDLELKLMILRFRVGVFEDFRLYTLRIRT